MSIPIPSLRSDLIQATHSLPRSVADPARQLRTARPPWPRRCRL